ncbi:Micronuclear linker histone polyprotein-like [Quillaja saponaria]|uniref:Micronuclear linker histone polyprotein-like n=1 Tax=Quillaja saponaria TaxID=32244 RepID=A0AAD7KTX2_QUISA|nr:Micronuclear linker histone polyprotein-like [Quillaja saponaria]
MAMAAFKSTTKRVPIGASPNSSTDDSSSSNRNSSSHRRFRSFSQFSRRLLTPDSSDSFDEAPVLRGRFVNTVRASGFPEISLDDLVIEFFDSSDRGCLASRQSEPRPASETSVLQRRGRPISRQNSKVSVEGRVPKSTVCNSSARGRIVSDANSRRRRSVSVVRYQISDSESDLDHPQKSESSANLKNAGSGNKRMSLCLNPAASNTRPALRRLARFEGMFLHFSKSASVFIDDEGRDAYYNRNGVQRIIQAIYEKKAEHPTGNDVDSGLYEAMKKELRYAVDDIIMEIEQTVVKTNTSGLPSEDHVLANNSDVIQAVSSTRRNYATKMEQSEKRKQDLLAELVLEEQHGREISKIVRDLLPNANNNVVEKPLCARKRSNDKSRMSKRLTEEAEKYIEDFISNVEDSDISVDGERSDTSSSLGGITKREMIYSPTICRSLPVEMDGVVLQWLQWETSNDAFPITPETRNTAQEIIKAQDQSNHPVHSRGRWRS